MKKYPAKEKILGIPAENDEAYPVTKKTMGIQEKRHEAYPVTEKSLGVQGIISFNIPSQS